MVAVVVVVDGVVGEVDGVVVEVDDGKGEKG